MVAAGEADRITRKLACGVVTMYRMKLPTMPSLPTACALSSRTAEAAAANQPGVRLTASEKRHIARLEADQHEGRINPAGVVRRHFTSEELERYRARFSTPEPIAKQQRSGSIRTLRISAPLNVAA